MVIENEYGTTKKGEKVAKYDIINDDLTVSVLNYGATIQSIKFKNTDVTLGYNTIEEYENNDGYFGATVGRCANRIAYGEFEINKNKYKVAKNNGSNHLHGGNIGFDKKIWTAISKSENEITFYYLSPDGEENYPGNLNIYITFNVKNNKLKITYKATSDKDTICNLTNHSYFNLNGEGNGDILSHKLMVNADYFLPVNSNLIPTGEIKSVKDTSFDFRQYKEIGKDIISDDINIKNCNGYDINFCINKKYDFAAKLKGDKYELTLYTDMPGIQIYTGNFVNQKGKDGKFYGKNFGVCLETQMYPDSINHNNFPSAVLKKNEEFNKNTIFSFEAL